MSFNYINKTVIENFAGLYGLSRLPGESDQQLATRIRALLEFGPKATEAQKLCYLLAKLGIRSAKKCLPVGVV